MGWVSVSVRVGGGGEGIQAIEAAVTAMLLVRQPLIMTRDFTSSNSYFRSSSAIPALHEIRWF